MVSLRNPSRLFCIYFILSVQYPSSGASPLHGDLVDVAPLEKLPFIVSLNNRTRLNSCRTAAYNFATEWAHFCGGSLITRDHVLTAAHCFISYKEYDEVVVIIGSTNLRTLAYIREVSWWYTYGQHHPEIELHDDMDNDIKDKIYDIAIMRLKKSVFPDFPLPTIMYFPDEVLYNKSAVMAGWGIIEKNVKPRNMRIGKSFILGPKQCSSLQPDELKDEWEKIFLCSDAKYAFAGPGDSGSPLLYDGINTDYPQNIIGVNSGFDRRGEDAPGQFMNIYVSVNNYRDFIELVKTWEVIPPHI